MKLCIFVAFVNRYFFDIHKEFTTVSFVSVFLCLMSSFSYAGNYLEIESDPGEWLFGTDLKVTDADGDLSLYFSGQNQLSGGFTWRNSLGKNNIQLTFFSGVSKSLDVGAYLNAKGPYWAQNQLDPSLNVNFIQSGRVCIPNAGEFFVYEFQPAANRYAINFTQDCLYSNQAKIRGYLRINSDYPKYDPNPVPVIVLPTAKVIEGQQYNLSAENSRAGQGDLVAYEWEQLSGPEVVFIDKTVSNALVTLPDELPLGGADLVIKLTVTNTAGYKSSTQATLHVDSKSDPQSFFRIVSGSVFPVDDGQWLVNIEGKNLMQLTGSANGLGVYVSQSTASVSPEYMIFMYPADGQVLRKGVYPNTTRMAGSLPGLDYSSNGYGCKILLDLLRF